MSKLLGGSSIMRAPNNRTRRIVSLGAAPAAALLAGLFIWQGSNAAFTASTRNAGSSWSAGTVTLTDDDLGAAAFQVVNVTPGATGTKCIVVTSTSNVPGVVKTYAQNLDLKQAKSLEKHITFKIEEGSGGSFNDCTGFTPSGVNPGPVSLETLAAGMHDYSSGGHPWTTTGTQGEQKSYRGTWAFDTTGMTQAEIDAVQGGSVSVDLVWELQNS